MRGVDGRMCIYMILPYTAAFSRSVAFKDRPQLGPPMSPKPTPSVDNWPFHRSPVQMPLVSSELSKASQCKRSAKANLESSIVLHGRPDIPAAITAREESLYALVGHDVDPPALED